MTSCKFSTSVISSKQKQILLFHYNSIEQRVLQIVSACTSYVLNSLMFTIRKSTFVEHTSFQRKDTASHMGCSKASVSRVINAVALKGWAAYGKQKKTAPQDDRQLCRIAKTNRFSWATQLSRLSQKWSYALGQEVSIATTFRHLREMGFCCSKPATKPLLDRKQKLKRLQWANMHKDYTKMHKNGQKSFLATNPGCASSLAMEELWFGELKMSATIRLVWRGLWSSQLPHWCGVVYKQEV